MNIDRGWFQASYLPGFLWFRFFGYGLRFKDPRKHRPLFSERAHWYRRVPIGFGWVLGFLHPSKPLQGLGYTRTPQGAWIRCVLPCPFPHIKETT
jgi:hypothetical protein